MKYNFIHKDGLGKLMLIDKEEQFSLSYFKQKSDYSFHTIAWNTGNKQKVYIDEVEFEFKENTVYPLFQSFGDIFLLDHRAAPYAGGWQFFRAGKDNNLKRLIKAYSSDALCYLFKFIIDS